MIQLNYRDAKPIYEQIRDGLRRLIITGAIAEGEKLPSVREMAVQLSINPNTIQRAYRELEQEGYIYMITGKGSFAAPLPDVSEKRRAEVMERMDEEVKELLALGMSAQAIKDHVDAVAAAAQTDGPASGAAGSEGSEPSGPRKGGDAL